MLCQQCRAENPDTVRFCIRCGMSHALLEPRPDHEEEPVLVLRPKFVPSLQILGYLPMFLFLGLWGGGFFGGFAVAFLKSIDSDLPRWIPFFGFGLVFLVGPPVASYLLNRRSYARTFYAFTPSRLDYDEGFLTIEEKCIALADVTEVLLRRRGLQKKLGLGTIVLATRASSAAVGHARSGIRITDVEQPEQTHACVKELVDGAAMRTGKMMAA